MPVVLDESAWDTWLDPAFDDVGALQGMLAPAPDEWFETYEVSPRVNSPTDNDAELLDPIPVPTALEPTRRLPRVQPDEYLDVIARQSERWPVRPSRRHRRRRAVVSGVDGRRPARALGNVQRWARTIVETASRDRERHAAGRRTHRGRRAGGLVPRRRPGLVAPLAAADLDADVWTFVPDAAPTFWFRRQAQEMSVHR